MPTSFPQDDTDARLDDEVYIFRHIDTKEFICLQKDGIQYVACFTEHDAAHLFREEIGLVEHVDIERMRLIDTPFDHYWLDGQMISEASLTRSCDEAVQ